MSWQWPVVLVIVAVAAYFVARRTWQTWHPPAGSCGGGCACPGSKPAAEKDRTFIPLSELTLRRQRGDSR